MDILSFESITKKPLFPIAIVPGRHTSNALFSEHGHDFYELIFVSFGSGIQIINGKVMPMLQGDLFFMKPGERHSYGSDDELEIINILIHPSALSKPDLKELFTLPGLKVQFDVNQHKRPYKIALAPQHEHTVNGLCKRMKSEFHTKNPGWKLAVQASLTYILIAISRAWTLFGDNKAIEELEPGPISKAIAIIYKEYREQLYVSDLARRVHLSPKYFGDLFKENCGISVQNYINKRRIDLARIMLEDNKMNITEIGFEVGFEDPNYFARIFKKMYSISPRQYRDISSK
jgi:AraC-like DNA-binding protein